MQHQRDGPVYQDPRHRETHVMDMMFTHKGSTLIGKVVIHSYNVCHVCDERSYTIYWDAPDEPSETWWNDFLRRYPTLQR